MKVRVYTVNQSIEGEVEDQPIVIPVLLKEYTGYQHSLVITINPDSKDYAQIDKARRKQNENITFVHSTLTLVGQPDTLGGWMIDRTGVTPTMEELFGGQWMNRLESFVQRYCTTGGLTARYGRTNMGEVFYIQDGVIGNAKNCVIHAFGKGKIVRDTIENVIMYIHGDYDEV